VKVIYVSANLLALLIGDIPESSFHKFQAGCQTEITVLPFLVRAYRLKARAFGIMVLVRDHEDSRLLIGFRHHLI
jgi:hypothetical protein